MRTLAFCLVAAFATITSPGFAADMSSKVEASKAEVPEIELPEITIIVPAAKFEHAIVRDNEVPVVLLLV
jgi:hypothetical protein